MSFVREYLEQIQVQLQAWDWRDQFLKLGLALAVTLLFLILLRILRLPFGRLQRRIESWMGDRVAGLRWQQQEILSAEEIGSILNGAVGAVRFAFSLILFFLYLDVVFRLFPSTEAFGSTLLGYFTAALITIGMSFIDYLPKGIFVLVALLVTRYLIKLARLIFNGIGSGRIHVHGFYPDWAGPTFNMTRLLIVVFAAIVVFPYLPGNQNPAFQAVSVFLGILLSLGSTGAVANAVSGVVITYMRPFQRGDRVKIADTVGDVLEKTAFVTRLNTPKNVEVTIPNSMVLANHIINFSTRAKSHGLIIHTTVTIGYDVPWRRVQELLKAAARDTDNLLETPEAFVLQTSLDDFYVHYELNVYTRHPERISLIYSELHRAILDKFHEAGIEILSPHFSAVRDGNALNVPSEHLPSDYNPPPFRIHPLESLVGLAGQSHRGDSGPK